MPDIVTLITGTRKGIGKFLAEYYVNKGHLVVGCSRSNPDWSLDNYYHVNADVGNESDVKNVISFTRKKFGKLDNLINNAGVASMNHSMLTPINTINHVINVNLIGTFLFCREAAKLMSKSNYGRIVNFTTVATPLKLEGEAIYAASKAAIFSLTQILAREFSELNITVNAIGPTPVETDLIRSVPKEKMERLISRQAIVRYGTPEDIANVINFYIHPNSHFVTGQNIYLGGIS
jgi:3-oxoacyl-[acyl-carrier protein] reductase